MWKNTRNAFFKRVRFAIVALKGNKQTRYMSILFVLYSFETEFGRSLVYSTNSVGPSIDPCRIPHLTIATLECWPFTTEN